MDGQRLGGGLGSLEGRPSSGCVPGTIGYRIFHQTLCDGAPDALVRELVRARTVDRTTEQADPDMLTCNEAPASVVGRTPLGWTEASAPNNCSWYSFAKPKWARC